MTRQLVVIACGAAKLDHPAPAADLYTGGQFRLALAAALQLADRADVLVLSAKHGLLGLGDVIAPYDVKMGDVGSIDALAVFEQARARQLLGLPIVALCPKAYAALLDCISTDVWRPLTGLGIGCQRQVLAQLRDGTYSRTI